MKKGALLIMSLLLLLAACEDDSLDADCTLLTDALVHYDNETLKAEVDKLTVDLKPQSTEDDRIGHRKNLNTLINRLNAQCKQVEASLFCYACVETLPLQSEITVLVDSAGTQVCRMIDIVTPEEEALSYSYVHACY